MSNIFINERNVRTAMLIGESGTQKLAGAHIAVFGLGGVGGYTVEALVRAGVGALTLVDHDTVSLSNLNRQVIATQDTVGRLKTDCFRERIARINPDCRVTAIPLFFLPETKDRFDFSVFDYVVDAVDTVSAKLAIIESAKAAGVPVISSMGTGNKLHPERFKICDISKTSVCPLAKVMRHELKKRGITDVKVLFSDEEPLPSVFLPETDSNSRKIPPASISFVPSAAGLMIAGEVIREIVDSQQ